MFVQFIEGPVDDAEGLRQQYETWLEELAPDAIGWLGSTGGVTADGTAFVAARFEDAGSARENSERPEQSAWWEQTAECFAGPVEFSDCDRVVTILDGGSDEAGFVQVIRGRFTDADRAVELSASFEEHLPEARPDVLGGYLGLQDDGSYTQVVYFTSEEEAREGEQRSVPELDELGERLAAVQTGAPRYLDLSEPWLASA